MRNLGLDVVRSIAIVMVIISHARKFFISYIDLDSLSIFGLLGVEIFFVLSGFLIGRIIIKEVIEKPSLNAVWIFYQRRWFRTLPLYFLVLIGVMCLYVLMGDPKFSILNFFFLQNYDSEALDILDVSWSLSVEEWFYLIVPLMFIVGLKFWKGKKSTLFFVFTGLFILTETLGRLIYTLNFEQTFDLGIRKNTFLRLDSIIFGVILAGVKVYYKDFYDKVTSYSKTLLLISLTGFVLINFYYQELRITESLDTDLFAKVFLFPLISFVCVFLVAALDKDKFVNLKLSSFKFAKVFGFISATSYCVYLIHNYTFIAFNKVNYKIDNLLVSILLLIIALSFIYLFSHLSFKYFESPILRYRDKVTRDKDIKEKRIAS